MQSIGALKRCVSLKNANSEIEHRGKYRDLERTQSPVERTWRLDIKSVESVCQRKMVNDKRKEKMVEPQEDVKILLCMPIPKRSGRVPVKIQNLPVQMFSGI